MNVVTKTELNRLIKNLEKDPNNLDLINSIALGYFENSDQKSNKEDYDFFEKAYQLKKTVKSTHNFAWFLYFEWSEIEWRWNEDQAIDQALKVQEECLALNPNSFYPYYQFGYLLIDQKEYKKAIPYLETAYQKATRRDILHNLGFCYFKLGNYQKAKDFFTRSSKEDDLEKRSLFNLALAEYQLGNIAGVKQIAEHFFLKIRRNIHETVSGYEIGWLYFLLNDFKKAAECTLKQGISGIDIVEWQELSFSLRKSNPKIWLNQVEESIKDRKDWMSEVLNNHEDWATYSKEEKDERFLEFTREIEHRETLIKDGLKQPIPNISKNLRVEYCGCLLFDCKIHQNLEND